MYVESISLGLKVISTRSLSYGKAQIKISGDILLFFAAGMRNDMTVRITMADNAQRYVCTYICMYNVCTSVCMWVDKWIDLTTPSLI